MKANGTLHRIALIAKGRQEWMGGVEYTRCLIKGLNLLPSDVRSKLHVSLLVPHNSDEKLFADFRPIVDEIIIESELADLRPPKALRAIQKFQDKVSGSRRPFIHMSMLAKRKNLDFVYPFFEPSFGRSTFEWASWIPDFQHKILPEHFSAAERADRDKRYAEFFNHSSQVVLSSQSAVQNAKTFYPDFDHSKVRVLHFHSVPEREWLEQDSLAVCRRYHLPKRFMLLSNQFWQHKNHKVVLDALKMLKNSGLIVPLVCTGNLLDYRNPDFADSILRQIHSSSIHSQVHLLGLIPRVDQIQLMRASIAVVQPSRFEGWSTVVEDARGLGKKLLASNIDVHLEQDVAGAEYFDPDKPEVLAKLMAEAWDRIGYGPDLAAEMRALETSRDLARTSGKRLLEISGLSI